MVVKMACEIPASTGVVPEKKWQIVVQVAAFI